MHQEQGQTDRAFGGQRDDPEARQVLPVIGDIREDERVNVEEAQRREKGADEEKQSDQGGAAPSADRPERAHHRRHAQNAAAPCPIGADLPPRIDERQIRWPDQLAEVEPDHSSRQETPLDQVQVVGLPAGSDIILLDPGGEKPRSRAHHEPGQQRNHVAPPGQAPVPPDLHEQKGGGQCGGDRFTQQGQHKEAQGQHIPAPSAVAIESQVGERCQEVEY